MKEIDVSRTPVREAFSKLEQEGFIEVIPKKGVLVKALTISIINQTFESRQLLEPFIIENRNGGIGKPSLLLGRK